MQLRRLLVAFLIATSGFIVGATAAGIQSAADAEDDTAFHVPRLHVGDQGQYNGTDGSSIRFSLMEPETWFRDDGAPVAAVRMVVESDHGGRWDTWLEAGDLQPIATLSDQGGRSAAIGISVGPTTYYRGNGHWIDVVSWQDPGPFCGLVHGLQGELADASTPMTMPGGCPQGTPAEPFVVNGLQARAYHAADITFTLVEDIPVPARIQRDGETWELVLFGRGSGDPAPETGEPHPITTAPYGHGPDTAGIDHPFPLHAAVEFALFDPVGNPLKAFFAARSDAYIASASHLEHYEPGIRTRSWDVVATDGVDAIAVRIIQDGADVAKTTSGLSVGTGLELPGSPVPRIVESGSPEAPYPTPDALPREMPTVASVAERWETHAGPGYSLSGVDSYGFQITCGASCDDAHVTVWAGVNQTRSQRPDEVPEPCIIVCAAETDAWLASQLAVDGQGRSVWLLETDAHTFEGAGYDLGQDPLQVDGAKVEGAPEEPPAAEARLWSWPSAEAAAGVSFLSVILGALYYFWPALKAAPIALFSRVRKDEALDHPVRNAIHAGVVADPGIHMNALARRVGKKGGVLRHHLDILIGKGLLKARRERGYTCYFPATAGRLEMDHAAVLRNGTARDLLATVQGQPGATMQEIAATLGVTPGTVTYHARRLEEKGLLHARRAGRQRRLYAA